MGCGKQITFLSAVFTNSKTLSASCPELLNGARRCPSLCSGSVGNDWAAKGVNGLVSAIYEFALVGFCHRIVVIYSKMLATVERLNKCAPGEWASEPLD